MTDEKMRINSNWNRCDVCGKYIAIKDFGSGVAVRNMVTPDSDYSMEEYETLCGIHYEPNEEMK